MYCRKCGATNDDNAFKCVNCGAALQAVPAEGPAQHVANHLVFAILATLFCCMPFGIVAIVYAAQVNGKLGGGDYAASWGCHGAGRAVDRVVPGVCLDAGKNLLGHGNRIAPCRAANAWHSWGTDAFGEVLYLQCQGVNRIELKFFTSEMFVGEVLYIVINFVGLERVDVEPTA